MVLRYLIPARVSHLLLIDLMSLISKLKAYVILEQRRPTLYRVVCKSGRLRNRQLVLKKVNNKYLLFYLTSGLNTITGSQSIFRTLNHRDISSRFIFTSSSSTPSPKYCFYPLNLFDAPRNLSCPWIMFRWKSVRFSSFPAVTNPTWAWNPGSGQKSFWCSGVLEERTCGPPQHKPAQHLIDQRLWSGELNLTYRELSSLRSNICLQKLSSFDFSIRLPTRDATTSSLYGSPNYAAPLVVFPFLRVVLISSS